jgi:hypothetical protein
MKQLDNKKFTMLSLPATEQTLKEVWRVWNLFPAICAADYRVTTLNCPERDFPRFKNWLSGQRDRLARVLVPNIEAVSDEFLKAFNHPFDDKKYNATLRHAEWWHNFARENYPVVATSKSGHVKRWLCFQDDNLPDSDDDVATWRTGQELIAQKRFEGIPLAEFWKLNEPTLALVEHAQRRWRAYRDARTKAREHFSKLDVPVKLADIFTPADVILRMQDCVRLSDEAQKLADQLTEDEKEMVRNPVKLLEFVSNNLHNANDLEGIFKRTHRTTPEFLSKWEFMFRCACGLVSRDELRLTLPTFFLKLSLDEKLKFHKFTHVKPRKKDKNRHTLLKTWLQDNAPVFSEFRWHTEAVLDAAADKFNDPDKNWIPEFHESLTQFCSRATPRIRLGLHTARYSNETDKFAQLHKCLITDPVLLIQ